MFTYSCWLDGWMYRVDASAVAHKIDKLGNLKRTLTYDILRQDADAYSHGYRYTLLCTALDLAQLRTSFRKAKSTNNQLDFVDVEGFNWNPATGTDDEAVMYSTGVYFTTMGDPVPRSDLSWSENLLAVAVELVPITHALPQTLYIALLADDGSLLMSDRGRVLSQG